MCNLLTLSVPPTGVPPACVARTADRLREVVGLGIGTIATTDPVEALLGNKVDVALVGAVAARTYHHSDVVTAAILSRLPCGDRVLAQRATLHPTYSNPFGIASGARVGVSSSRQAGPLLACCEDAAVVVVERGNGNPHRTILDHSLHALILSELELGEPDHSQVDVVSLRPEVLLPAPAQGILVLMSRADAPSLELLLDLDDRPTRRCMAAELELLELVGPRRQALGCLAHEMEDGTIRLLAALSLVDDDLRNATVTKVGALTSDPLEAGRACFAAFEEIGAR